MSLGQGTFLGTSGGAERKPPVVLVPPVQRQPSGPNEMDKARVM